MTRSQQVIMQTAKRMDPWIRHEVWQDTLVLRFTDGSNVTVSPSGVISKLKRVEVRIDA